MVAGDLNSKFEQWFANSTNKKGALLPEFVATYEWSTKTIHFHPGFGSHKDVTFVSESLAHQIKGWVVQCGQYFLPQKRQFQRAQLKFFNVAQRGQ